MKYIIKILISLICLIGLYSFSKSNNQSKTFVYNTVDTFINKTKSGSTSTLQISLGGTRPDSVLSLPPTIYADTATANFSKSANYSGSLIMVGTDVYYRTLNPNKWNKVNSSAASLVSISQGYGILNTPNPITTTGSVTTDTTTIVSKNYFNNLGVKYSDTSSMLSNRLKISDTASMLSNRLKISDTLTMLSNYRRKTTLITNGDLTNSSITITAGTGLIGGGVVSLGGAVTLSSTTSGTVTSFSSTASSGIIDVVTNTTTTPTQTLSLGNITPTSLLTTGAISTTGIGSFGGVTASGNISALTYSGSGSSLTGVVKYTDTLSMLSGYMRTSGIATANGVSGSSSGSQNNLITVTLGAITPSSVSSSGAITGTTLAGTIVTASQPNITTVGTLSALTVTNSITAGTLYGSGRALSGVVTSVAAGTGITVASSGGVFTVTNSSTSSGGTVTSIATSSATGITGGTITNTGTLSLSAIPNSSLANSTISGISLGSNLPQHGVNWGLSGTSYNGSATITDWKADSSLLSTKANLTAILLGYIPITGNRDVGNGTGSGQIDFFNKLPGGNAFAKLRVSANDDYLRMTRIDLFSTNPATGGFTGSRNAGIDSAGNMDMKSLSLSGLTSSRAVVTDGSKGLATIATTAAELGYVNGVTAPIQTQLDSKGAGTLTAIGVTTANGISGSSSGGTTPNLTLTLGNITPSSSSISGQLTVTGFSQLAQIASSGTIRVTGGNSTGFSGSGVEIDYGIVANTGRIFAYDRTGGAFKSFQINGVTISSTQAITTGSPSGGTAQPWKFGEYASGAVTVGGTLSVEVNGVVYYLMTATSL